MFITSDAQWRFLTIIIKKCKQTKQILPFISVTCWPRELSASSWGPPRPGWAGYAWTGSARRPPAPLGATEREECRYAAREQGLGRNYGVATGSALPEEPRSNSLERAVRCWARVQDTMLSSTPTDLWIWLGTSESCKLGFNWGAYIWIVQIWVKFRALHPPHPTPQNPQRFCHFTGTFNLFTAPACKISGLKHAQTCLQRVYFPSL